MVKVEHNACLSTSLSPSQAPGSSSVKGDEDAATEKKPKSRRPDYILVIAYIMIYLEIGWLIFMILRMYSRD